ncbi:uncharacterized protein [Apostichopus japonicus]|uniref:uncharacterized protein n=1 Tax=Stichopus japonicus TaxID=307972 RepID=UPI003AB3DAA9
MKSHLLSALTNKICKHKAYPSHLEFVEVAKGVISKYPCLSEKGASSGCDGLVNSPKYKMGNMRSKMRSVGCFEMKVNSRKRSDNEASVSPKFKKPKRAELNYLPDLPNGEDDASMEVYRKTLIAEVQKRKKDMKEIHSLMTRTFAHRRQELVLTSPSVTDIMERWPGLFMTSGLYAEFGRLTNMNLNETFFASLNKHLDRMVQMLKSRKGVHSLAIQQELQSSEGKDIVSRRTAVLRSLPFYFKEKQKYYKDFKDAALVEEIRDSKQRIAVSGGIGDPVNICIIIDGNVVIEDISDFPCAVALYFGIHYCLNPQYCKQQGKTMELIQKVFMNIDED